MRFTIDNKDTGTLKVRVGNVKEYKEFEGLDLTKIYQWYPMNISYVYRFQEPRDRLYLYPVKNPPLTTDYNYEYRTRRKPKGTVIADINPTMACMNVMKDNMELCMQADELGLPHLLTANYTHEQSKKGILDTLGMLDSVKDALEKRLEKEEDLSNYRQLSLQEQDNVLYLYATETELNQMKQIGKLYTMLNLMRKISKEREK